MSVKQVLRKSSVIQILGVLLAEDACRFTDLKDALGLSSSTVTRRLMELQQEGLVEAIPNFENRQFEYRLTKEGHRLAIGLGLGRLAKALAEIKN